MKNNKIKKLESLARDGFLARAEFVPGTGWENEVIADIKRRHLAEKFNNGNPQLLQPKLVWRFAATSLTVAVLICLTLYLVLPTANSNDSQTNELTFDNFDTYIETIAQL